MFPGRTRLFISTCVHIGILKLNVFMIVFYPDRSEDTKDGEDRIECCSSSPRSSVSFCDGALEQNCFPFKERWGEALLWIERRTPLTWDVVLLWEWAWALTAGTQILFNSRCLVCLQCACCLDGKGKKESKLFESEREYTTLQLQLVLCINQENSRVRH